MKHQTEKTAAWLLAAGVGTLSLLLWGVLALGQTIPTGSYICHPATDNTITVDMTLSAATVTPPPPPPPPPTTPTFLTDYANYPVPTVLRPELRAPMTDPTFKTTITRITDRSMSPDDGANKTLGLRHEYSKFPSLNADNTKFLVVVIGGINRGWMQVRELATGALVRQFGATRGDAEAAWHPTDPNTILFRTGNELRVYHVDTGQSELMMAFPQYYAVHTSEGGRASDDWHYWTFLGFKDSSFTNPDIGVADLVTKQVLATMSSNGKPIDWVGTSPTGAYSVVMWLNGDGTRLYNHNLVFQRTVFPDYGHSNFAFDASGAEVMIYRGNTSKQLAQVGCPNAGAGSPYISSRLSDAKKTLLLGDCYTTDWQQKIVGAYVNWGFTSHYSGLVSRKHPGWILVSTYGDTPTSPQVPFSREIFLLALDGSGRVKRLAHHHSEQFTDSSGNKDYWSEPQATSSWSGDMFVFASTFGALAFTQYDDFLISGNFWP